MKFLSITLFLVVAPLAFAFAPPMLPHTARPSIHQGVRLSMVEEAVGSDISIPYDAAARLAYDEWRSQYNKGAFDEKRFVNFKNNYETITVANVIAKKRARDSGGTETAKEMTLNQYADFTKEEYEAMQSGTTLSASKSVTNGAMETSAAPFEQAMSGIEQILAQAAKAAQSAKESIESSLKSASSAAKSVDLNTDELLETAGSGLESIMEIAAKSIDAGLQAIEDTSSNAPETEEEREAREARLKAYEEARIEAEKQAAEAREKRAAELAERAKQEAARRKEIEEERALREKTMAAEAAKAKVEAEKLAIAAAKAQAEQEAARAAERAKIEAQAAQKLREQARAWEEQQRKMNAKKTKVTAPVKKGWTLSFPSPTKSTQSTPVKKAVVVKKTAAPATPAFSFFSPASSAPAKKAPAAPVKKAVPAPSTPFSFFPTPAKTPAKTAPPAPSPLKKPAAPSPSFSFFAPSKPAVVKKVAPAPIPAKAPATPAFSFFGAPTAEKKKADVKVPNKPGSINLFAPKPTPKKDVKVPSRPGTISLLSPTKSPAPSKPFSFFNAPKAAAPEPKKETPVKQSSTFSLFGSSPLAKQAPAGKKPDVKVPNQSGTLSVFGISKAPPNVPVLSSWRQNPDGSISGKVSNSKGFKAGTEITTSPVKKGAKAGTVVKTGSGSQYYLN